MKYEMDNVFFLNMRKAFYMLFRNIELRFRHTGWMTSA